MAVGIEYVCDGAAQWHGVGPMADACAAAAVAAGAFMLRIANLKDPKAPQQPTLRDISGAETVSIGRAVRVSLVRCLHAEVMG